MPFSWLASCSFVSSPAPTPAAAKARGNRLNATRVRCVCTGSLLKGGTRRPLQDSTNKDRRRKRRFSRGDGGGRADLSCARGPRVYRSASSKRRYGRVATAPPGGRRRC